MTKYYKWAEKTAAITTRPNDQRPRSCRRASGPTGSGETAPERLLLPRMRPRNVDLQARLGVKWRIHQGTELSKYLFLSIKFLPAQHNQMVTIQKPHSIYKLIRGLLISWYCYILLHKLAVCYFWFVQIFLSYSSEIFYPNPFFVFIEWFFYSIVLHKFQVSYV